MTMAVQHGGPLLFHIDEEGLVELYKYAEYFSAAASTTALRSSASRPAPASAAQDEKETASPFAGAP
jgi:hypothetical protein